MNLSRLLLSARETVFCCPFIHCPCIGNDGVAVGFCLSVCLSFCLSVCLSLCLSVCLYACISLARLLTWIKAVVTNYTVH